MQRFEAVERFFELSLLGLVAAGFLAVAGSGFLDAPTVVLVAAGLFLRGLLVLRIIRLEIPERLINIVTISYIGFFILDYFQLSGHLLEATVHLICFLAVMKVLTARTSRDFVYTAAIALMELVAAAMFSNNLSFFAYLALYLVFAIAAFTSAEMRRALGKPGQIAGSTNVRVSFRLVMLTGFVTAGILVMTAGLFIVLPRTANAAFRHLIPSRYHLTGFSSVVSLGQVGEIQKDTRPVMHIKLAPYSAGMPADIKWRGVALSHFDGKRWTDLSGDGRVILPNVIPLNLADEAQRSRRDGFRLAYRVDLSTNDADALFIAGIPEWLNIEHARVVRTATDSYRLRLGLTDLAPSGMVRYEVSSFVPYGLPAIHATLTPAQRRRYLQLPPLDERIGELARKWTGQVGSPEPGSLEHAGLQQAAWLQRHLRSDLSYSLDLPQNPAPDPLADFLFVRKKGHCEYFATAMTVMLRSLGTPARIVNGFQSGTYNSVSGMYVVRSSDAHSWVEAFDPGAGWVTFDPTPSAPRPPGNWILTRAGFYLDAAESFWQDWVVNYDLDRQISLAGKLDEKTRGVHWRWQSPDWKSWSNSTGDWMRTWGPTILAGAVIFALGLFLRRILLDWRQNKKLKSGRVSAADATALYERMLLLVKRRGFQKPPWFTPGEFAATLPDSELAVCVNEFTEGYQALRFGGDGQVAGRLAGLLIRIQDL